MAETHDERSSARPRDRPLAPSQLDELGLSQLVHRSLNPVILLEAARSSAGDLVSVAEIYVNPAAESLFGSRGVRGLVPPGDDVLANLAPVFDTGTPRTFTTCVRRDDQTRWFIVDAVQVSGRVGVTLTEITDLKRPGCEPSDAHPTGPLEFGSISVLTLARGIAHDLNNVLQVLYAYAALVEARIPAQDPARGDLRRILAAARAGKGLVGQLTWMFRRTAFSPVPVRLNALVAEYADALGCLVGEEVVLRLDLQAQRDRVLGIPGELEHVLLNLSLNGRDAMPRGGALTIATKDTAPTKSASTPPGVPKRRCVVLSVSDTGRGMSDEILARAFEPSFTTKDPSLSTGFGLSFVQAIVERHGGIIELQSAEGQGTTAQILLPCIDASPGGSEASAREEG